MSRLFCLASIGVLLIFALASCSLPNTTDKAGSEKDRAAAAVPPKSPPPFDPTWTTVPAEFKGDDIRKMKEALSITKDEYQTTADYEEELKNRQPNQWVFLPSNINFVPSYDADRGLFRFGARPWVASVREGTNIYNYFLWEPKDERIQPLISFEYAVPREQASQMKDHFLLLTVWRPMTTLGPRLVMENSIPTTRHRYPKREDEWTIILRVHSLTEMWLLDDRSRAVLHKYTPQKGKNGERVWR